MNDVATGTFTNDMAAYGPCTRCGTWHRVDFSCDTAARVEGAQAPLNPCPLCKNDHPVSITCLMYPAWKEWEASREKDTLDMWGETIEEAWRYAESVARLDRGIALLDKTEPRRVQSVRCDAVTDGNDRAD